MNRLTEYWNDLRRWLAQTLPHRCNDFEREYDTVQGSEYEGSMIVKIKCGRCDKHLREKRVTVYY